MIATDPSPSEQTTKMVQPCTIVGDVVNEASAIRLAYAAQRVAETRAAQGLPDRPSDAVLDVAASIAAIGGDRA
jgi:hypothetical protein